MDLLNLDGGRVADRESLGDTCLRHGGVRIRTKGKGGL